MNRLVAWLRRHRWPADVGLVALLVVPSTAWLQPGPGPVWVAALSYAALVLPLPARRRYPAPVAAFVIAAAWVEEALDVWGEHLPIGALALIVVLYNLVVLGRRRQAAVAAVGAAGFFVGWALSRYPAGSAPLGAFGFVLLVALAWVVGDLVRSRRAYIAEVESRAVLAESERRALARVAVAEERNRIARDLHDVLAHGVSVMVVNAEGARLMRHADPDVVDRTLDTISATGRSALVELRRLLEVLHVEDDLEDGRAPRPGVADLGDLVSGTGTGGPAVTLAVAGSEDGLPAAASLQTYRIVQEALTNVVKHAPRGAPVRVAVDLGVAGPDRRIRIDVTNAGETAARTDETVARSGEAVPPLPPSGRGLDGVRERVAMFGGTLEAGPTDGGGYRFTATLPLDGAPT